jgi:hypothetical protein
LTTAKSFDLPIDLLRPRKCGSPVALKGAILRHLSSNARPEEDA